MLKSVLISPIARYFRTKSLFKAAKEMAKEKGKMLMVIGDPCSGNYFLFMSSMYPKCEHGDVTIDMYGLTSCCNSSALVPNVRFGLSKIIKQWP